MVLQLLSALGLTKTLLDSVQKHRGKKLGTNAGCTYPCLSPGRYTRTYGAFTPQTLQVPPWLWELWEPGPYREGAADKEVF